MFVGSILHIESSTQEGSKQASYETGWHESTRQKIGPRQASGWNRALIIHLARDGSVMEHVIRMHSSSRQFRKQDNTVIQIDMEAFLIGILEVGRT